MHSTFQGTYFRNHSAGLHPKAVRDVCFFNQRISGCLFLSPRSGTPSLNEASESGGEWRHGPSSHSQAPAAIYLLIPLLRCQSPTLPLFIIIIVFKTSSKSISFKLSVPETDVRRVVRWRRILPTPLFPPPPVHFRHLWRPLSPPLPSRNVFNCRTLAPTG